MTVGQKLVKLTSSEGTEFKVERIIAEKSILLKNMLDDVGEKDMLIEYCTHHRDELMTTTDDNSKRSSTADDIDDWDAEFCKVDQGTLFELILAANYLDIKPLLDLACKTVANMIKSKSPEEIRRTFNIENDFTPEEEEQVRKENEWCD
ncbi:11267_t:CDS:2 [Entrophospora sp. SA101]|nr:12164_t:CDS:2 [Entrophospora candida]CAH1759944.1 4044_t:CDS:2 [Entrophospora sp. SA101]CAJ0745323.1 11267_t:CDS:2 [Entrophospora sp. SA101]CAJ0827137.1 5555_t:CDS:2 [Entrophospora sp. SA101]CAJ0842619.1 9986_t:CDS:2 [Entrophospora sp. SA101]